MRRIALFFILFSACSLYASAQQYYYTGTSIEVIKTSTNSTSYPMLGNERLAIATNQPAQYLVGDNKSRFLALGTTLKTQDYHPYGKADALTNIPFGYNNEYQDPSTQLLYLRTRDYQAQLARFITRDSFAVWNHYSFTDANPIMNIDPSGHLSQGAIDTFMGIGVSILMTGLLAETGGRSIAEAGWMRNAAKLTFVAGNSVPAAISAGQSFAQGNTMQGIGQALVSLSGVVGSVSAQPEIMLDAAARIQKREVIESNNTMRNQIDQRVISSAMLSQGLLAIGSGFQLAYTPHTTLATKIGMIAGLGAAGIAGGYFYGRLSAMLSGVGGEGVAMKMLLGSVRTGITGAIAAAPTYGYELANHESISAESWAVNIGTPFVMGAFSGLTQTGFKNSSPGFHQQFLGYSAARMSYLFVKPPLWSAMTSGDIKHFF